MNKTVGTCSICGGRVVVPEVWHGISPPIPTCEQCGATKKQPHGPVIDMEKPAKDWLKPSIPTTDLLQRIETAMTEDEVRKIIEDAALEYIQGDQSHNAEGLKKAILTAVQNLIPSQLEPGVDYKLESRLDGTMAKFHFIGITERGNAFIKRWKSLCEGIGS